MEEETKPVIVDSAVIVPVSDAQPAVSNAQAMQTPAPTYSLTKRGEQNDDSL